MPEDQLGLVVHRSDWALERNANVFVWWPTGELIACLNDAVTPVTVQTLIRWLGILASDDDETVVIKRVWLEHYDVLAYAPQPLPDSKPLKDSHLLTKGVYGCFVQDPIDPTRMPKTSPWTPLHPTGTFKVLRETRIEKIRLRNTADSADARIAMFMKNTGVSDDMRARSSGPRDRCAFTGSMGDGAGVDLHWIFPPFLFDMNETKGAPRSYDLASKQACRTVKNVLPMCEAVHKLWFENAFSVDVEDSYRIRTFTQAAVDIGLLERLIGKPEDLALSEKFLREHFFHTTLVRVRNGDIHDQDGILDMIGAIANHKADLMEYGAKFDPKDEIWQSEVGRDALELIGPEDLLPDSSRVDEGNSGVEVGEGEA
ncbi:hypothetical protein VTO73DRAFT_2313 [Trametes versicolor]